MTRNEVITHLEQLTRWIADKTNREAAKQGLPPTGAVGIFFNFRHTYLISTEATVYESAIEIDADHLRDNACPDFVAEYFINELTKAKAKDNG